MTEQWGDEEPEEESGSPPADGRWEKSMPAARLLLASYTLAGIFVLVGIALLAAIFGWGPEGAAASVLDLAFKSLVPIASLVLGFCFGRSRE